MKTIDERKRKKISTTEKNKGGGGRSYSERLTAKRICCAFKLGFLQLICKASVIFKSSLELA